MNYVRVLLISCVLVCFGAATSWAAGPLFVSPAGNDSNTCLSSGAACLTINGAIGKASAGDTINVAAGTYNEQVVVNKTLTLRGAQAGVDARTRSAAESIITNTCGPVQIQADNVVLNGFTMQGANDASSGCFFAGIWTNPGFSGTQGGHQILNNIIQNNISGIELDSSCTNSSLVQFNLIQNNNNAGPGSGNAIQTNFSLCKATVDSNKFAGHSNASILINAGIGGGDQLALSNNELVGSPTSTERIVLGGVTNSSITGNTSIGSTATNGPIRLFFGNANITITGNVLRNGVRGIKVDDIVGGFPNTNITAHQNCIVGNTTAGLEVTSGGHSGTLNANNNWWGSTTGPTIASNPGGTGDAIIDPNGVVVYAPFLTAPATACAATAADLTISKTHSGNFQQGDPADTYTITVSNAGPGATSGSDPITVTDTLPSGLTPTAPNGAFNGWSCTIVSQTVTCTRNDVLAAGNSYPVITLTVSVAANAPSNVTNTATVSGGGETNTANDSSSNPTTIGQVADLTISKTHSGTFKQGDTGDTYTLTVTNSGSGPTTGTVTVSDTLPAGLTPTGPNGVVNGWNCSISTQTVTCTRSDVLAASLSYPAITLTVNVANNAAPNVTNTATVSGGGEVNGANDSSSDSTAITQLADVRITKSVITPLPYAAGSNVAYTITVLNMGASAATNVVVSDTLPAGSSFVSATPSQGSCSGTATVTCNLGGLVNGGSATITLVLTTSSTPGVVSNTATVSSTTTDPNPANNSSTATITTIAPSLVPAISQWALLALLGILALLGALKMRA